jgi:small subunit ribosomal protein S2
VVEEQAQRVGMHCVTNRWLGGMLTNFREIRKRIGRLEQLEQMEADGMLDAYSKKEGASLRREMRKILRNLGGIRNMKRLPGALVVIDQKRELIAIKEGNKIGIPVICLLDTECDPDVVDIPIPGNDDAMRAVELVVKELCDAVEEGIRGRAEATDEAEAAPPRRRSRRQATARAKTDAKDPDAEAAEAKDEAEAPPAAPVEPSQSGLAAEDDQSTPEAPTNKAEPA